MSWNLSLLSGPWQVPIYGAPVTVNGTTSVPITGYQSGVVFIIPTDKVTPALQSYAGPIPVGVPVLAGVNCTALSFSNEESAKIPLATYWENDL